MRRSFSRLFVAVMAVSMVVAVSMLMPAVAWAQAGGSGITGAVLDTSGAVLPGVTVEASSPVLIEGTRVTFTDGTGRYRFVDLRPGVYTVVFTLPGFSTLRREELELPDVFTMTINAQLQVGALEETITVTGESPLVDIQNVTQAEVLSRDVTEAVLAGRFIQNYITYIPGVTGATLGFVGTDTRKFQIHGGRVWDSIIAIDGFSTNFVPGFGGNSSFYANQASVQEISAQTAGQPAEQQFGGIWINLIPKEGGNQFSGYTNVTFLSEGMVGANIDADLEALGIVPDSTKKIVGFEPAGGGPLVRDRLWFYSAARYYTVDRNRTMRFDVDPLDFVYTPDLTRPAHTSRLEENDWNFRLTAQVTPRNKLMLYFDQQPHYFHQRNFAQTVAPEATNYASYWPNSVNNVTWKSTVSNSLLLEAGAQVYLTGIDRSPVRDPGFLMDPVTIIPVGETEAAVGYRASGGFASGGWANDRRNSWVGKVAASYVTGSHALKFGWQWRYGDSRNTITEHHLSYEVECVVEPDINLGCPAVTTVTIAQLAKPLSRNRQGTDGGLFIQDQWTMDRMTLNLGLRFDYLNEWVPANSLPAGPFVPARSFPKVDNVPNYKDISPRFGFVYDLTNDGKTAFKATVNKFMVNQLTGIAGRNDPFSLSVDEVERDWDDVNGDFIPDCDLTSNLENGECGEVSDLNFGSTTPSDLGYHPDLLTGWGVRNSNMEIGLQVQRELMTGMSAEVGYFRRTYDGFVVRDNLLVEPSDYNEFCADAPQNAGLPGGGGYEVCGYYDLDREKQGQRQRQYRSADEYQGEMTEDWQGVDGNVNVRMAGATLSGGFSTGRVHTKNCAIVDIPIGTVQGSTGTEGSFCDTVFPWLMQVKFQGSYTLPHDVQLSGVYRNVPGAGGARGAGSSGDFRARRANVRFIEEGNRLFRSATTVDAVPDGTIFQDRQQQIDLRIGKIFNVAGNRFRAAVDIYNLTNRNAPQRVNNRISSTWPRPTEIQQPRMMQLTFTWDY